MEEGAFAVALDRSPLAPERSPVGIRCRAYGGGPPLMLLHGGWGYEPYPFDRQIPALAERFRVLIPDRTGYGGSERIDRLPTDFHRRAAEETLQVLQACAGPAPAVLWGHSDGAVIALHAALIAPGRVRAVIAESTHLLRRKPASREFFETIARHPERVGDRLVESFARAHGDGWRQVITMNGDVWLRLADEAPAPDADLFDGALESLRVPVLLVHGGRDPRTEPGELERLRAVLGCDRGVPHRAIRQCVVFPDAGHSPHSSDATAGPVTETVLRFLERVARCQPDLATPAAP